MSLIKCVRYKFMFMVPADAGAQWLHSNIFQQHMQSSNTLYRRLFYVCVIIILQYTDIKMLYRFYFR